MSIKLSNLISNGMVIQKEAKIWGYATEEVIIDFNGKSYRCEVVDGYFETIIKSEDFGGPYTMKINDIIIEEVYVGYVFLCSGQSNMELPINRVRIKYEEELKNVENKNIRAFNVERNNAFKCEEVNCEGSWKYANAENIDEFFALPYFFGVDLEQYLNVPIGLINCAVGGSDIKSWLSEELLKLYTNDYDILKTCQKEGYVEEVEKNDLLRYEEWHKITDKHDIGLSENFIVDNLEFKNWDTREVTNSWVEDIGAIHGVLWFKVVFNIEKENLNKDAKIFLGTLKDSDITYVNGVEVGTTAYQYPPRIYSIDKALLKLGENVVTVRLYSQNGLCGFTVDKEHKIVFEDGAEIKLPSKWHYKLGCKSEELSPATYFWGYPTGLYNGMLYPTFNYSITGFLWYQGESNTHFPEEYDILLSQLVKQVRGRFGEETQFLVVQLPNFEAYDDNVKWETLRKKQASILNYENTALINTIGLGEDNDLHPLNKKDIGIALSDGVKALLLKKESTNERVIVNY